ncbi:hypothetical protein D3C73_1575140 [compost metagenome]
MSWSTSTDTGARVSPVAAAMSARERGRGASKSAWETRARLYSRRVCWRAAVGRARVGVLTPVEDSSRFTS